MNVEPYLAHPPHHLLVASNVLFRRSKQRDHLVPNILLVYMYNTLLAIAIHNRSKLSSLQYENLTSLLAAHQSTGIAMLILI